MTAKQNNVIFNEVIFENDIETIQMWINELQKIADNTGDMTFFNISLKFNKQYLLIQKMYANLKQAYEDHLKEVNVWNLEQLHEHELLKKELEDSKNLNYRLYCKYVNEKKKTNTQ